MAGALKFAQARLSPPTFGQVAAETAIDTPNTYFPESKEKNMQREEISWLKCSTKWKEFSAPKPLALLLRTDFPSTTRINFLAVGCWKDPSTKNPDEKSGAGQTVMLAPAEPGDFIPHRTQVFNEVRIAYVLKIEDLKNAMQCLEESAESLSGKSDEERRRRCRIEIRPLFL